MIYPYYYLESGNDEPIGVEVFIPSMREVASSLTLTDSTTRYIIRTNFTFIPAGTSPDGKPLLWYTKVFFMDVESGKTEISSILSVTRAEAYETHLYLLAKYKKLENGKITNHLAFKELDLLGAPVETLIINKLDCDLLNIQVDEELPALPRPKLKELANILESIFIDGAPIYTFYAKIGFNDEYFWVQVVHKRGMRFTGRVANILKHHQISIGSAIEFSIFNIIQLL